MLILPIVNQKHVMNVQIRLKNAEKIRKGVFFDDAKESDIIINREKFSNSTYKNTKDENAPIKFIRAKSINYPRSFWITTCEESDSNLYDVYQVPQPPKQVNENLDKLYSKVITDMRKEIPNIKNRGRYISFKDLGLEENLSEEKIRKLQQIVRDVQDTSKWPRLFEDAGIADLKDTIDFINNFECTIIDGSEILEETLEDTIKSLSVLNSRDYKNLKKLHETAKTNTEIYTKISYINQLIYSKPLNLIRQNQKPKQLVKKYDEVYHGQQAA